MEIAKWLIWALGWSAGELAVTGRNRGHYAPELAVSKLAYAAPANLATIRQDDVEYGLFESSNAARWEFYPLLGVRGEP